MDIERLCTWIGRDETESEVLTPALVRRFNATFDRSSGTAPGDEAPLLIHLCLAQPIAPMSALGRDGHPALGGFLPPVPLPRRMWAGGTFDFHGAIRIGETVTRRSVIHDVTLKRGRSGQLRFVTIDHEVTSDGRPVLNERQDIVYRDAKPATCPATEPEPAAAGTHTLTLSPTPTLLFRYSALTFNGHRIHYDRTFCTETEGYPGLVVHGPMQATLLCQFAANLKGTRPSRFEFRSLSPLFDTDELMLHAAPEPDCLRLWTARPQGPVAMEAQAHW
ncbi:MaoC family dehydratase N-terminal domain-containing protein [Pararhodobacter sp. SW119]|uniref:FAS1-like dehydratase domain-containing protein n=1 Tax=Pararhodobacter sp. SW119 TaxID=2780075 RepID=UPI001AE08546|nr:MaoC family dehydratase N-terminal domain-containing protein [Pararhodobacter sp. SW119]